MTLLGRPKDHFCKKKPTHFGAILETFSIIPAAGVPERIALRVFGSSDNPNTRTRTHSLGLPERVWVTEHPNTRKPADYPNTRRQPSCGSYTRTPEHPNTRRPSPNTPNRPSKGKRYESLAHGPMVLGARAMAQSRVAHRLWLMAHLAVPLPCRTYNLSYKQHIS